MINYRLVVIFCLAGVIQLEARHIKSFKSGDIPDNKNTITDETFNMIANKDLTSYKRRYVKLFKVNS